MKGYEFKNFKANCENKDVFENYTQYMGFAFMNLTKLQSETIYNIVAVHYGESELNGKMGVRFPNGLFMFK